MQRLVEKESSDRASGLLRRYADRLCVWLLLKTWTKLFSKLPFTEISEPMAAYMIFDNSTCQFQMLVTRSGILPYLSQQMAVENGGRPSKCEERVDIASLQHFTSTDHLLRYMTYLIFDVFLSLILSCKHYSKDKEGFELVRYVLDLRRLLQVI